MMKRLPWIPQWKWDMLRFFRWGTVLCPSACPCVERKHCYRKIRTAVGGGGNGGRSGKGRIICSSWGSGGVRRARARRTGGWPTSTAKRNVKAFVLGKSRRWLHTFLDLTFLKPSWLWKPCPCWGSCYDTLHHQVAMAGCLPTTAVVVVPVHRLWGRVSAPRTHILHRLGDNLCGCRCRVDNSLIVRLKSKSLRGKQIHTWETQCLLKASKDIVTHACKHGRPPQFCRNPWKHPSPPT